MSSEVASGHVSIFPVMTGFKGKVDKEVGAAGASGAKSFESSFKGAGAAAGRTVGRDLKSALTASAGDLGSASLTKLTSEVASASAALARVRLKQQDDAGRVRVAEVRLQEAIAKSGASSSQAVAAEERLAAARRVQQASIDAVQAATVRLTTAQESLRAAQSGASLATAAAASSSGGLFAQLRQGFTDTTAARSSFTSLTTSVGGLLRAVSDVSGLTKLGRLAKLGAAQVSTAFTSMATAVGGRVAAAWATSSRWMSSVGSSVATALRPVTNAATVAGKSIATPFIQLGTRVAGWMSPVTSQVAGVFSKLPSAASGALSSLGSVTTRALRGVGDGLRGLVGVASRVGSGIGAGLAAGFHTAQGVAGVTVAVISAKVLSLLPAAGRASDAIDKFKSTLNFAGLDAGQIDALTKSTQAYADATVYDLADIQGVTAQLAANGVKDFDRLAEAGGNLNAVAGGNAQTFKSVGMVLTQTAGAGKLTTENWNQLADAIPGASGKIQAALLDAGAYTGNFREAMEKGEISAEEFNAAILQLGLTDVAKNAATSVSTFEGAIGNLNATITGGLVKAIAPLKPLITGAISGISTAITPFFDWLAGKTDQLATFAAGFTGIGDSMSGITGLIAPLGAAFAALSAGGIGGLLARVPLLSSLLPGLSGALSLLGGPIGVVAAGLAGFVLSGADAGALVSSLTGVISSVVAALPGLVAQVATFVPQLVSGILSQVPALLGAASQIVTVLVDGLVQTIPVLVTGAVALVTGLLDAIIASLPMIVRGAVQLVTSLVQGIITALPLLITAAIQLVTGLIKGIISALPLVITAAVQLVTGLLTAIVSALPMIIEGGVQLLLALVLGIVQALPMILQAGLDLVMQLIQAVVDNLPMIIEAGIQMLLSLVTGLIDALPQLITAAINLVLQLVVGLLEMLPKLIEAGIELVVALIVGLVTAIPKIIEMLPQIVSAIWDGLAGVNWLDLGVQIVMGIINGLSSMVGALVDAITDLAGKAFEGFKDFFGIASPAKRMIQPGRDVVRGAIVGTNDEAPAYGDALAEMAQNASKKAQAAMGTASVELNASSTVNGDGSSPTPPGGDAGGGDTFVLQGITTAETAEQLAEQIEKKKRRRVARTGALRKAGVS